MSDRIGVLAGNLNQYDAWLRRQSADVKRRAFYIHSPEAARGLMYDLVLIGTWYELSLDLRTAASIGAVSTTNEAMWGVERLG